MALREKVTRMAEQVDKMYCVLTGDCGKSLRPQQGLVFKVNEHEKVILFLKKFGWAIFLAALAVPSGVATVVILNIMHVKN